MSDISPTHEPAAPPDSIAPASSAPAPDVSPAFESGVAKSDASKIDAPKIVAQREANKQLLTRVFKAIGSGDATTLAEAYTDDYTLELPYSMPEPVKVSGLANVGKFLADALGVFRFTLTLQKIYDLTDPDILIAEYTSQGEIVATGAPYNNNYVGIWRFRDGKVCGTKEWYNPAVAAAALAE